MTKLQLSFRSCKLRFQFKDSNCKGLDKVREKVIADKSRYLNVIISNG